MEKINPQTKFRKELERIMPGYKWTVHRSPGPDSSYIEATGIQSAGFNRLSTLSVVRREKEARVEYEVKTAGFGKRAPWLETRTDVTLASALRRLQDHYETVAQTYGSHAGYLQGARKKSEPAQ